MKIISILGSTGSIGQSTLSVIESLSGKFVVSALAAGRDLDRLAEQAARFQKNKKGWRWFQSQAPWYQRTAIHWVVSAKKEETRDKRLAILIRDSAAARTIPPLTRR